MNMRLIICILTIYLLNISCSDSIPLSPQEQAELNRAKLYMEMTDDYELEIRVKNFDRTDYVKFYIVSNEPSKFDVSDFEVGEFTSVYYYNHINEGSDDIHQNSVQCIFSNVKDDGLLIKLALKEPNSIENISYHFSEILIIGPEYQECTIDDWASSSQCLSASGIWKPISENFQYSDLCYIKNYPDTDDPYELFGGDFKWSDRFCYPWQN
tara:strand:- start:3573 stop:4205 length:633 start_codon:yes stop_codon:yes gene_type:complete